MTTQQKMSVKSGVINSRSKFHEFHCHKMSAPLFIPDFGDDLRPAIDDEKDILQVAAG